jgi:hypothetical protein
VTELRLLGAVAFLFFIVLALGPVPYPQTGVDASWSLAITEASLRNLTFGRDIVFTYGPLGYLAAGAATPEAFHRIAWARMGFAAILAGLVTISLVGPGPIYRKIGFLIAMAIAVSNVALPFSTILATGVCLFSSNANRRVTRAAFLGTVAGVFSLMKFTNAIDFGLGIGGALAVGYWLDRSRSDAPHERAAALVAFVSALLATSAAMFAGTTYGVAGATAAYVAFVACLAYAVLSLDFQKGKRKFAGPSLGVAAILSLALCSSSAYRQFLWTSLQLSLGYSSAMTTPGAPSDLAVGLLLLALVAIVALINREALGWGVAFGIVVVAWLTFKAAFVRQDGHIFEFYSTVCVIFAVLVRYARSTRAMVFGCFAYCLSVLALAHLDAVYVRGTTLADNLSLRAFLAHASEIGRALGPGPDRSSVAAALAPDTFDAPVRARLATMPVDVVPAETALIFANGFRWAPEPVFQSYSAYTPALDRINADSLQSKPRRVLYSHGSIDGRAPFAESPLAYRTLLCDYHLDPEFAGNPVTTAGGYGFIVLTPSGERCSTPIAGAPLRLGWNVALVTPRAQPGYFVLASIRIRPTPAGALERTLFRAPPVYVTFSRADGSTRLRILPDQAPNGVLVDPLPTDNATYAALESGRLAPSTTSMTLSSEDAGSYEREIDVTFLRVRYHD